MPSLMRVGDSLTVGLVSSREMGKILPAGWIFEGPFELIGKEDGPHAGVGGKTIAFVREHVEGWMEPTKPDVVQLWIGTNDLAGETPVSALLEELRKLVRFIQSKGVRVVLGTVPPFKARASRQTEYDVGVSFVAKSTGATLADVEKSLFPEDMASDGVHLSASGNKIAATVFVDALKRLGTSVGPVPAGAPSSPKLATRFGEALVFAGILYFVSQSKVWQ